MQQCLLHGKINIKKRNVAEEVEKTFFVSRLVYEYFSLKERKERASMRSRARLNSSFLRARLEARRLYYLYPETTCGNGGNKNARFMSSTT